MRIVEVYKEIQEQEMNILKAFYVDLLVPLETNLEKDTKVVQSEQKKFLQQHKTRSETYSKAAATMKKHRKKSRAANKSGLAMDKELKNMQILEEEKTKLDAFCEQSLKNAMTQERRRYGFVLERQCSLAKHYASFHEVALAALHPSVDKWREVAATREYLPQSVEDMFASRLRQTSFWPEDEENGGSELTTMSSQLRKTRSMDSSCLELRLGPLPGNPPSSSSHLGPMPHLPAALSRARSEANLHASTLSLGPDVPETPPRPRSMAPPASRNSSGGTGVGAGGWGDAPLARALFAYLSSGENQLSFLEGDLIALMGDRQKGWQFGENLRTQSTGWFPLAYTEIIIDDTLGSPSHAASNGRTPEPQSVPPCKPPASRPPVTPASIDEPSGGTVGIGINSAGNSTNANSNNGSNVGTPTNNASVLATPTARQSKSIRPSGTLPAVLAGGRRVQPPVPPVPPPAMTSLHSSNDSGFSNEPPVQPDVDYSDDEALRQRRRKPRSGGDRLPPKDEKESKDWENDSWKTIPRDEKSWHLYRTAMDLWAESKAKQATEETKKYFEMENGDFALENGDMTKKRKSKRITQVPNERPSPNQRTKISDERNVPAATRRSDQRHLNKRMQTETEEELEEDEEDFGGEYRGNKFYANNQESQDRRRGNDFETGKYGKSSSSSVSDDESTITIPEPGRKVEHIAQKLEQTAQKYAREHSPPKFLERRERSGVTEYKTLERETREMAHSRDRHERSAAEYKSLERGRDGRDGQKGFDHGRDDKRSREEKHARDNKHTLERGSREEKQSFERAREEKQSFERVNRESKQNFERSREDKQNFERAREDKQNFERSREDKQSFQRPRDEHPQSYERARAARNEQERAYIEQRKEVMGYERTFEKNRNRTIERLSSRRFERPRPPSQEAPERPMGPYRERRYSDKEEAIYGETGRYGVGSLERDRGYESNFETKLERSKVIERHGYHAGMHGSGLQKRNAIPRSNERSNGDTNNNTLKVERKPLLPRQATAMGHLAQTGRAFEEPKSPKLVKRTKSFWKFRRDSEVLEGMALWQHRSLVDIPKMIRKEKKIAENEEKQRNSDGGSPNSSLGSEGTITNDHQHEEPKPAERSHVPDKADYAFEDMPTPAERPKITERSDYRMQQQSEERTYFIGNVSRKAIIEKERRRSLEAKRNMIVAELKENNESKRNDMMTRGRRNYDEEEDATLNFSETEASDEESTYSCIVVKDQSMPEKTLLPRTKLRRESDRDKNTCGPWYDLWGVDASVKKKKKQKQQ
ncbi:Brain-specific angiogenesis inhibitor 1-associated protein [Ooceraea biroi]|uniref:Brain-specific angiogenesis inhibitor 1-associated protein n=1 Tax=Ooceraea biroi TaxID=2015173 RepID=A0A026WF70_OOCBI|nr:Brain-specific angiogenesis inhibitor 1-associated protein [Ooceraea biroi]